MSSPKLKRKVEESLKRQRQKEIKDLKKIRETKKALGEVITKEDYHPSGHLRHGKF